MHRAVFIVVVATLFSACAASGPKTPVTKAPLGTDRHVVVYLLAFFNNENAQRFDPSPIDYSPMIDPQLFYSSLGSRLAEKGLALISPDEIRVDDHLDEAAVRQFKLSLYNTLVVLRAFLLGLPEPARFEGAPMPGLVTLKTDSPEWRATGTTYVVIGLETTVGETGTGHALRSGLAVLRLRPDGAYERIAFGPYDFTNVNAHKLSDLVSDLIGRLEQDGARTSELPRLAPKPLQPPRAAWPSGQREASRSGPRG